MSDASIDAVIAEVFPEAPAAEAVTNQAAPEAEAPEVTEPQASEPEDVPFPKKAVNAISRRDKQIGKLRAEYAAAQAELERLRTPQQPQATTKPQPVDDGRPKEADFEGNYGAFLEATAAWGGKSEAQKLWDANQKQQAETQQTEKIQAYRQERETHVSQEATKFLDANPEAREIVAEYADLEIPEPIAQLLLEADNAPLAFFNLAKEGKLEELVTMHPARAALVIAQAQLTTPTKPKTNAPAPLPAARGSAPGGKRVEDLDGDGIRSWMKSK